MSIRRDPHCGPVPESAWERDAETRARTGRVEIFNATRPGGLDGWTMDPAQYQAVPTWPFRAVHESSHLLRNRAASTGA